MFNGIVRWFGQVRHMSDERWGKIYIILRFTLGSNNRSPGFTYTDEMEKY